MSTQSVCCFPVSLWIPGLFTRRFYEVNRFGYVVSTHRTHPLRMFLTLPLLFYDWLLLVSPSLLKCLCCHSKHDWCFSPETSLKWVIFTTDHNKLAAAYQWSVMSSCFWQFTNAKPKSLPYLISPIGSGLCISVMGLNAKGLPIPPFSPVLLTHISLLMTLYTFIFSSDFVNRGHQDF